jgi:predicted ABC-type ATPase
MCFKLSRWNDSRVFIQTLFRYREQHYNVSTNVLTAKCSRDAQRAEEHPFVIIIIFISITSGNMQQARIKILLKKCEAHRV